MIEFPSVPARVPPQSSRNLDDLLGAYFKSEMPSPWPGLRLPKSKPIVTRRWQLFNSRLALAATVAFCLVGSLTMAGLFPAGNAPGNESGKGDTIADKPIFVDTPNGPVKVSEKQNGNKVKIVLEPVEPPEEE